MTPQPCEAHILVKNVDRWADHYNVVWTGEIQSALKFPHWNEMIYNMSTGLYLDFLKVILCIPHHKGTKQITGMECEKRFPFAGNTSECFFPDLKPIVSSSSSGGCAPVTQGEGVPGETEGFLQKWRREDSHLNKAA